MGNDAQSKLQEKVTGGLNDLFAKVIDERKAHYIKNPQQVPMRDDAKSIINRYSNTNGVIAGAAGLVPGPWGMLAAVPEILAVIRNQTQMIFDLGVAYGQHRYLRSELVVGILLSSMGSGGGSLIAVQGGKLLVRRASLRVMQRVVAMLGGKVTQQLLKSMVGKWLPVVGAAAMAAWARYTTKKLGERACEMLSKEIVDGGDVDEADLDGVVADTGSVVVDAGPSALGRVEAAKVRVLTNLMLADQQVAPEEVDFIGQLIENTEVSETEKASLREIVSARRRTEVDYAALQDSPEDRAGLLFSMVALANRDGSVHLAERLYIKQVGLQLGFSESDVASAFQADNAGSAAPQTPVEIPWRAEATVPDPQFGVPVSFTVEGKVTVMGGSPESRTWVAEQAGKLAVDALARSTTSIALAWTQTSELGASLLGQLDTALRPHQMHALSVDQVDVQIAPESMAALEAASA